MAKNAKLGLEEHGHKVVFRGFPPLPTRPRLMLPCKRPCLVAKTHNSIRGIVRLSINPSVISSISMS